MKTLAVLALTIAAACALTLPVQAQSRGQTCVVADPTGTPLNLREAPNGEIIGTIRNGFWVRVRDLDGPRNRAWAHVHASDRDGRLGEPLGWVFYNHLNCR